MSLHLPQHCLGCGKDVPSSAGTRCLSGDKSQHIVPLWISIFSDELQKGGEQDTTVYNSWREDVQKVF